MTEDLDQFCDHAGPTGLMAGPEARAVIAVEVLIEQDVVLPQWIGLELLRTSKTGRRPDLSRRKIPSRRLAISWATSNKFINLPEPVGHSILKLSP